MTNTIVLYFSKSGSTKHLAKTIAHKLNADLAEIHEAVPYTIDDLNWNDPQSRTTIEQHQSQSRVAIKDDLPDISKYDNVIIAHPIWWAIPPRLIATLIDTLDLNNKQVATCATSGGTDYTRSQNFIERTIHDNHYQLVLFNGAVLNSDSAIDRWLKTINFTTKEGGC